MDNRVFGDRLVATSTIDSYMNSSKDFHEFIQKCVARFAKHEWGDTCREDKKQNDDALKHGERLLASYNFPQNAPWKPSDITDKSIWIITEWDRSVTTILLPSEY